MWFAKFVDILFNTKFVRKLIFTIIFKSFFSSHHQHSKNLQTVRKGIFSMLDQNLLDFLPKIKGREVNYCILWISRLNDKFLKSAKIWKFQFIIQGRRKVWKSGGASSINWSAKILGCHGTHGTPEDNNPVSKWNISKNSRHRLLFWSEFSSR